MSFTAICGAVYFGMGLASAAAPELPDLLGRVERKYNRSATLVAKFTQTAESKAFGKKTVSRGTIELKRPDKVRWETVTPNPNLLVSDGLTTWYYTPPFDEGESGQVVLRKSAESQSRLARALLQGQFSAARDMTIRQETPTRYLMIPKRGTAGTVEKAWVSVEPKERLIDTVVLLHRDGNRTEIRLHDIELTRTLKDDRFVFSAPAGTQVVENE